MSTAPLGDNLGPAPAPSREPRRDPPVPAPDLIEVLVGQALDDLDTRRLDVAAVVRLVAATAWREGYVAADHHSPGHPGPTGDRSTAPVGEDLAVLVAVIIDPRTGEVDVQGPFDSRSAREVTSRIRTELDANAMAEFTMTLARLRPPGG